MVSSHPKNSRSEQSRRWDPTITSAFTLTTENRVATLDYDYEVAGLPYFSDGPSQYATDVANSRRTALRSMKLE
ncbi:hypothetical protein PI125_g22982 [Phytophthora idaei]|nr:hypothetical protein PI125_g22982 [Phytophthora idaei]